MSHYAALAVSILLAASAQVLLKSAAKDKRYLLSYYLQWRTVFSYGMLFLCSILNLYVLQGLDLKTFGALISVTYVLVAIMSRELLQEDVGRRTFVGCCLIVLGAIIFNSSLA